MNLDVKEKMVEDIKDSIEKNDISAFANNMIGFMEETEKRIKADYEELKDVKDARILESRGYHALTSQETKFYDKVVEVIKTKGSAPSLDDVDVVMPETIFNEVFNNIKTAHPLLDKINVMNTRTITDKIIMNTGLTGTAGWGELCDAIDDEIKSGFGFIEVQMNKLSAYMFVCMTLLDLGYEWLHRFCVDCLSEAIAAALEDAVVNGTGSKMPIGMIKEIADLGETQTIPAVTKDAIEVTDLGPATLGTIAKTLSNGGTRKVNRMIMVVNPLDAYDKVMPATTIMNAQGEYITRTAFPMDIIESAAVAQGKAVFGIGEKYFLGVGLGKNGRVDYSDHFKFLDDLRTIKQKVVAGGQPVDNAAFVYADISNLQPAYLLVKTVEEEISA